MDDAMLCNEYEFFCERAPFSNVIAVFLKSGKCFGKIVIMKEYNEGEIPGPLLKMSDSSAQQLMDHLWNVGIRPSTQGSPGQIAATERHLEDMRGMSKDLLAHVLGRKAPRVETEEELGRCMEQAFGTRG